MSFVTLFAPEPVLSPTRQPFGTPDGAPVDLSLIKLPEGALMFPNLPEAGEGFSFTALRNPDNATKELSRKARKLGFPGLRPFHDLRGSHETILLDRGVPVHVVAARWAACECDK